MISDWLDRLREWDRSLLLALNGCNTPMLDDLFSAVTNKWFWVPAYVLLAWHLFARYRAVFFWLLFSVFITVLLTDQLSSTLLKPLVHRLRPCHVPGLQDQLHLVDGACGGSYGFVSSHAANTFGFFVLMFVVLGRRWNLLAVSLLGWAILVSFSRVYLAVHYPGDIIGGGLLGSMVGFLVGTTFRYINGPLSEINSEKK